MPIVFRISDAIGGALFAERDRWLLWLPVFLGAGTGLYFGLAAEPLPWNGPSVLALGISGASQHMAGCGGAKTIVAINNDPTAQIFKSSRFGIVGDCQEILPPLIDALRVLRDAKDS